MTSTVRYRKVLSDIETHSPVGPPLRNRLYYTLLRSGYERSAKNNAQPMIWRWLRACSRLQAHLGAKRPRLRRRTWAKFVETADLKVVTTEVDGKPTYYTMERVEDPTAKLFKLGLKVDELEAIRR